MNLETLKSTLFVRIFGIFKIPLFAFTSPSVVEISEKKLVLKIPLNYRTRNHLGVMYFGALNIGAEASAGVLAMFNIQKSGKRIDFLFKDYKVNFLKRADGDVHFICEDGEIISDLIQKAAETSERLNATLKGYAVVPKKDPNAHIAEFEITLTVKRRG